MKLLIPEPPLQVLPSLAVRIGLNEAIVVQQLHYLTLRAPERFVELAISEWLRHFPFWSAPTLKRTFATLRQLGVVDVTQPHGVNRRNRYEVVYEAIERLYPSDQIDPMDEITSIPSSGPDRSDRPAQIDPIPNRGREEQQRQEASSANADDAVLKSRRSTTAQQLKADERALEKLAPDLRPFVAPVHELLSEVAASKPGSIAPEIAAVARLVGTPRLARKDFIPAAERLTHWALHGLGRGRKVRDVVATYRNWLAKEPDVLSRTIPSSHGAGASGPGEPRLSPEWHRQDRERRLAEAME